MNIYLAHPISGLKAVDVFNYYDDMYAKLKDVGYRVLTPMYGKDHLRCEKEFRASGYKFPCTTNHALFNRDKWMVEQADVVYANLMSAPQVSIGTMMELAWASHMRKHVIVSMPVECVHAHAFVFEAASVVYNTHEDALDYLGNIYV